MVQIISLLLLLAGWLLTGTIETDWWPKDDVSGQTMRKGIGTVMSLMGVLGYTWYMEAYARHHKSPVWRRAFGWVLMLAITFNVLTKWGPS
ncbi:hypothetical protein [Deinococcus hopiensis]|uniref:Uncharacterized protein n=1 Tax=Deinococcus hopiensis KR-140 TaxID=695939 RepID=A0A1W1V6X9_9DEIO|nr:hypothetical protein [Deinococcus hopiensis]SMB89158.1 hypothetical protein SAMN00790413_00290 [Deinococcus hopiensis KR-140]